MHWPGQSREKAMRPGPSALVTKKSRPAILRLIPPFSARSSIFDGRLLPQQRVVLEHHRPVGQLDLQLGHEPAADVVGDPGEASRR